MGRHLLRCVLLVVALAGCGGRASAPYASAGSGSAAPGLECAPFARELSGIALYGDAASWWDAAAGRYTRGSSPEVGGVLVFRRSGRLPSGHVSVVSRLLAPRRIEVIQANWVHGELDADQLVVDVSEDNDWSLVRVWYPPVGALGAHPYEAYGFVLPDHPATHAELARATAPAMRLALASQGASRGRAAPIARLVRD